MEMDDVPGATVHHFLDLTLLEQRTAALMCKQWRQRADAAPHLVAQYTGMVGKGDGRLCRVQQSIRVHAVHHLDVIACVRLHVCQPVNVHGVPTEAVWRVERGEMKDVQRALSCVATSIMSAI